MLEDAILAPISRKKLIEILIKLIETDDFGGFHAKMIKFLSLTIKKRVFWPKILAFTHSLPKNPSFCFLLQNVSVNLFFLEVVDHKLNWFITGVGAFTITFD